jgi:hypothetical protein
MATLTGRDASSARQLRENALSNSTRGQHAGLAIALQQQRSHTPTIVAGVRWQTEKELTNVSSEKISHHAAQRSEKSDFGRPHNRPFSHNR